MYEGLIATEAYVTCHKGDVGAFKVKRPEVGSDKDVISWLRPATLKEAAALPPHKSIYVEVPREFQEHPYAKIDLEEVYDEEHPRPKHRRGPPRQFASAAVVFTPQKALMW